MLYAMRTTLTLADDVFSAVKERAKLERRSIGAVTSDLVRAAMTAASPADAEPRPGSVEASLAARGFRPLPRRGGVVTNEMVNRIREELGE
jgi:hypothetical protein